MTTTPEGMTSKNGGVKTLAIRLEPDLHAQLSLIAQLRSSSITDEIRQALDTHITAIKTDPDLAGKADGVLADIERDAATRREAIATLFGTDTGNTKPATRSRSKRADDPSET